MYKLIRQLKDVPDGTKVRKLTGTVSYIVFRKIEIDKEIVFEAKPGTVFMRTVEYEPAKYFSEPDEKEVVINMSYEEMEELMSKNETVKTR